MQEAVTGLKLQIGNALMPVFSSMATKMSDWASKPETQQKIKDIAAEVGKLGTEMSNWITTVAIPWVQTHWPEIKRVVGEVYDNVKTFVDFILNHQELLITAIVLIGAAWVMSNPALNSILTVAGFACAGGALGWLIDKKDVIIGAIAGIGLAFAIANPELTAISLIIIGIVDAIKWINGNKLSPMSAADQAKAQKAIDVADPTILANFGKVNGKTALASGTDFAPGGVSLVGENGPELVNLPRGSQVIPNDKINKTGTTNITINISGNADKNTVDYMAKQLSRQMELVRLGVSI
jgi:hypothetical protein